MTVSLPQFRSLRDVDGRIQQLNTDLRTLFDGRKQDDGTFDLNDAEVDDVRAKSAELSELVTRREQLAEVELVAKGLFRDGTTKPVVPNTDESERARSRDERKSLGQLFVESSAYTQRSRGAEGNVVEVAGFNPAHELKATMTTSAGFAPEATRSRPTLFSAQEQPTVLDAYPTVNTNQVAVVYMEETTYTNAAAAIAEAGAYAESTLVFTERSAPVRKVGHMMAVTDEQLDDVDGMRGTLDNRMTLMVRQKVSDQLVNGSGTSPQLPGLLNVAGIQTQAKGTDPTFDAFLKAIVKIADTAKGRANVIFMTPLDWQDIALTRTTDGVYILGNPSQVIEPRLWGLPIVFTNAPASGTAIVLDTLYVEAAFKRGIEFQITNSHASEFANGVQRIRADVRLANVVYRPAAVCTVTGI